ncbi:MAG: SURF1 family protein [Pseudomonadota bacterium]
MSLRRFIGPLILGLSGTLVLASLGVWQVQRLAWKEGVLAEIESRIAADPVPVPDAPTPEADKYLPVRIEGDIRADDLHVLTSVPRVGPGHRLISPFELSDGRLVLLDEGFIPEDGTRSPGPATDVTVIGNIHWPDDVDSYTPDPDLSQGLFFGRDIPAMAAALGTEPILIVARQVEGVERRAMPLPVTTEGIPNNHLGYAVQWFGLALVWAGMTLFLLWRTAKRKT